jgi:hypothetical protein
LEELCICCEWDSYVMFVFVDIVRSGCDGLGGEEWVCVDGIGGDGLLDYFDWGIGHDCYCIVLSL